MVTRTLNIVPNNITLNNQPGDRTATWTGLLNGDNGSPWPPALREGRVTAQVLGTFGVGGSIQLEGSNDSGVTWSILRDLNGNNCVFTAAGLVAMPEPPQQLRPNVTAGDGTTSLTVKLQIRAGSL